MKIISCWWIFPFVFVVIAPAIGSHQQDWDYDGSVGRVPPNRWYQRYPMCAGNRQSPIDIVHHAVQRDASLKPIQFMNYDKYLTGVVVENDGHTLKVHIPKSGNLGIQIGDVRNSRTSVFYRLLQLHFHWPSEHRVDGRQFPLEMHLVHANSEVPEGEIFDHPNGVAVLVVLFDYDNNNNGGKGATAVENLIANAKWILREGQNVTLSRHLRVSDLLPSDRSSYMRYSGSMTRPPCNEVTEFYIFTRIMHISQEKVRLLSSLKHEIVAWSGQKIERRISHNERPLQKRRGRMFRLHGYAGFCDFPAKTIFCP